MLLRPALAGAALSLALALELAVIPRTGLPYAVPALVLLVVLALAAAWGPAGAAGCGFAGGLMLDLAPPAVGPIGAHAFVYTLLGAAAGRFARGTRESALRTSLLAGIYAAAATLLVAGLDILLGDGDGLGVPGRPFAPGLLLALGATALSTAVATPLVVPGLVALARRSGDRGALLLAPNGYAAADPVSIRATAAAPGLHAWERG
jgi:rod shape-determining protein MreD